MRQREFLSTVLRGHDPAVRFCERVFNISQVVDDLHDKDRAVTGTQRNALIWDMLTLTSDPFYRYHFYVLQPMLRTALNDWFDSTQLEQGDHHDRTLAFVLRDQLTGVVSQCAYLVGGYDWLRQVSVDIRRYFHDETLEDYESEEVL